TSKVLTWAMSSKAPAPLTTSTSKSCPSRIGLKMATHFSGSWPSQPPQAINARERSDIGSSLCVAGRTDDDRRRGARSRRGRRAKAGNYRLPGILFGTGGRAAAGCHPQIAGDVAEPGTVGKPVVAGVGHPDVVRPLRHLGVRLAAILLFQ